MPLERCAGRHPPGHRAWRWIGLQFPKRAVLGRGRSSKKKKKKKKKKKHRDEGEAEEVGTCVGFEVDDGSGDTRLVLHYDGILDGVQVGRSVPVIGITLLPCVVDVPFFFFVFFSCSGYSNYLTAVLCRRSVLCFCFFLRFLLQ